MSNSSVRILLNINRGLKTSSHLYNNQTVRVRFAPSPTGSLHLGSLRSALYNYIFARKHEGSFVLRIEDTDQKRLVPGSAEQIEDYLEWAGLRPDESPRRGGQYGPYLQSERIKLYQDRAHELVEAGKAYYCFCSRNRLELLRISQSRNREKPHYDGKCKHLSPAEVKEKMAELKGQYAIRFILQPGQTIFDDLVYGTIANDLVTNKEGDPIILKSDNFPTYHLANVVDDHSMKISHVIRGSEWISSTCKHIQLYKAFGWNEPKYIHVPLISMTDGSKMSKRNEQSQLHSWIQSGYRPLAMLNFLTNSGGGIPKTKQDSMELWTLERLIQEFNFCQISKHAASADLDRLRSYNTKDIVSAWNMAPDILVAEFKSLLKERQIELDIDDDRLKSILKQYIGRIVTLNDLVSDENTFIWSHPVLDWSIGDFTEKGLDIAALIKDLISVIGDFDNSKDFEKAVLGVMNKYSLDKRTFYKLLRMLLTNRTSGLPIYEIYECLGRDRFVSYLKSGLNYVS